MHMADALLSPPVGGLMLAASAAAIGFSLHSMAKSKDVATSPIMEEKKIPLMGIMGAFVFAGQMINFTIPATGSSGHIGGGILLAALLGPAPALITLASVLLIQCLFFADGGLLAFGCNVFNMGVTSCLFAYTLIYKPIVMKNSNKKAASLPVKSETERSSVGFNRRNLSLASVLSVTAGLVFGSFLVTLETYFSGVTELPFAAFCALMLPIHLAIGLAEGVVTAAVLCFVYSARPEILTSTIRAEKLEKNVSHKKVLIVFASLTVIVAGFLSIFASSNPDGLEWSMERTAGTTEFEREGAVYTAAAEAVEKTAFLPDYGFKNGGSEDGVAGTAVSGLIGSAITLAVAAALGFLVHGIRKRKESAARRL